MRTGAVPLPLLGDPERIATAGIAVSELTHADPLCTDACVLWTVSVDAAVATGEIPDIRDGLAYIPTDRRNRWEMIIDGAEVAPPGSFTPNGYVVTAFQAAWSSISHTGRGQDHFRDGVTQAVRIGNDTDTVAAITGTMLGATYGASAIPPEWIDLLHGWPGYVAEDLGRLAMTTAGPTLVVDRTEGLVYDDHEFGIDYDAYLDSLKDD